MPAAQVRNAVIATEIRTHILEALRTYVAQANGDPAAVLKCVDPNILKLLKDSEDRGFGTPKTSVDLSTEDPSMHIAAVQQAVLAALARKYNEDE